MRHQVLLLTLLSLVIGTALANNDEAISLAQTAAASWLELSDEGEHEETWVRASSLFQAAISQEDWARALSAAREPLQALMSRELSSAAFFQQLPGAPDGEYVVLTFDSAFGKKASAVETVTVMKDDDGSWRVSGYFIR